MEKLVIYNGFGIEPSKNYTAAGYDFHLPLLNEGHDLQLVFAAFCKSYKKTAEELNEIIEQINLYVTAMYSGRGIEFTDYDIYNIVHLFLGLTPPDDVDWGEDAYEMTITESIDEFVTYRLELEIKDGKITPGIVVTEGDYLLFNSGIKVGLPVNSAGIFFNKSGNGNKGYDTRACVVDEDYSGFVHLSVAFTKSTYYGPILYCGDKVQQMIVLPVVKTEIENMNEDEYNELMKNSQRGSDGFGSSDIKH